MKRIIFVLIMSMALVSAKSADIRTLFVEMPDSIMPLLTKNNKLDCLDYLDIDMPSNVTNRFGGNSQLKFVKEDMLSVQMTSVSDVDLKLLYDKDSTLTIVLVETMCGGYCDSKISFYNEKWEKLNCEDIIELPVVEDFVNRKLLKQEEYAKLLAELLYRMFTIDLNPGSDILKVRFSASAAIVDEEKREQLFVVDEICYRWNGKKFIRLKNR